MMTTDDGESGSDGKEEDGEDDDDKTPEQLETNKSLAKKSAPVHDSGDEESSSASDGEADDVMETENVNTDDWWQQICCFVNRDQHDEVLTTIHCVKMLAMPLHRAMKKGKTGPTKVAKMEAIVMRMGSIEEMLNELTSG